MMLKTLGSQVRWLVVPLCVFVILMAGLIGQSVVAQPTPVSKPQAQSPTPAAPPSAPPGGKDLSPAEQIEALTRASQRGKDLAWCAGWLVGEAIPPSGDLRDADFFATREALDEALDQLTRDGLDADQRPAVIHAYMTQAQDERKAGKPARVADCKALVNAAKDSR